MAHRDIVQEFLERGPFAVFGASTQRSKYGNKVFRCYLQHGLDVVPVNPHADEVEGQPCFADLLSLPAPARSVSFITPPAVTEQGIEQAITAGVEYVWMQPGAESARAVARAREAGLGVIADGSCLLVVLGFRE